MEKEPTQVQHPHFVAELTDAGVPLDEAQDIVDRVDRFYFTFIVSHLHRPLPAGLTAERRPDRDTAFRLHVLCPPALSHDSVAREQYKDTITTAFQREVIGDRSTGPSLQLVWHPPLRSNVPPGEFFDRLFHRKGLRPIGLLSFDPGPIVERVLEQVESHLQQGDELYDQDRLAEAENEYTKAIDLNPGLSFVPFLRKLMTRDEGPFHLRHRYRQHQPTSSTK